MEKEKLDGHIFLIGFMGCGKSTNAACLSDMTGAELMEMDQEIANSQGMAITEIFKVHGEEYFRDLETSLLYSLKDREPLIVSCGGGAVLRRENVEFMEKNGKIVFLTAEPETIFERVRDSRERPVEHIRALMEKRYPSYREAADLTISTDRRTTREICLEILDRIRLTRNK